MDFYTDKTIQHPRKNYKVRPQKIWEKVSPGGRLMRHDAASPTAASPAASAWQGDGGLLHPTLSLRALKKRRLFRDHKDFNDNKDDGCKMEMPLPAASIKRGMMPHLPHTPHPPQRFGMAGNCLVRLCP